MSRGLRFRTFADPFLPCRVKRYKGEDVGETSTSSVESLSPTLAEPEGRKQPRLICPAGRCVRALDTNPHFSRPVRNAHSVPTSVGVSRESIRPGKLLPSSLRRVTFSQTCKLCEKVRLTTGRRDEFALPCRTPNSRSEC